MATSILKLFNRKYEEDPLRFESLPGTSLAWNPRKLVRLSEMVEAGDDKEDMAKTLDVDASAITRKINETDWKVFGKELASLCSMSEDEYLDRESETHRFKMIARASVNERKGRINKLAWQRHVGEQIVDKMVPLGLPKAPSVRPFKQKAGTPEAVVLLLSDAHVGLKFNREETGDLNEYNKHIFHKRAMNLRQAVVDIVGLHSKLYRLPELHVLCLGDLVQGTMLGGAWGPAYVGEEITDQVRLAADAISESLSTWSTMFDMVTFDGVVGNHGRAGASKNSDRIQANFDNFVYDGIRGRMSLHKNVSVSENRSWWGKRRVNNVDFAFMHGDFSRGAGSINGIIREEQKIQAMLGNFDILCIGHFHTFSEIETPRGRILVNGSFVGGDVYSMQQLAAKSRPTQTLLGVHPKHGITWKYNLDLDTKRS